MSKTNRGFTMIELLIVITVTALMMSLLARASYRFVAGSRESATIATIMKVSGLIDDRVRAFHEADQEDSAILASNFYNLNHPTDAVMSPALAEIILRKQRFKKSFPQCFAELDASQISRFFPAGTMIPPVSMEPKYESGIVLYAMLLRGETFGSPTPGDDTFIGAEVKNTSATGNLPCIVDAWGEPLRFYRWPTRLIRCGEWSFSGKVGFDDYNQNGVQDRPGWVDIAPGKVSLSPAIRPYSLFPSSTPASLLMPQLSLFDRAASYSLGSDGKPGIAGFDDDGLNGVDDKGEIGWPASDDLEFLSSDPDDPTFNLYSWFYDPNAANQFSPSQSSVVSAQLARRKAFVTGSNPLGSNLNYRDYLHDFFTFHAPLIVSSGPDKTLGLWEPTDVPTTSTTAGVYSGNFGYLAAPKFSQSPNILSTMHDDISNFNHRAGGSR